MLKRLLCFVIFSFVIIIYLNSNISAREALRVVTTAEFLADWARQIGGEHVEAQSVHNGKTDMHFFEPRPIHVKLVSEADLFITPGLDLDVWMQPLLNASRNPKIQYGSTGYIDASFGVHTIQKPSGQVDMSMGDVHPYGNPHYLYNLENVGIALENILTGLIKNDPENEEIFKKNKEAYWRKAQACFESSRNLMLPFKGTKVVCYHQSWEYFANEFGLEIIDYFEKKPGIPPSSKHIKSLIEKMNQLECRIILKEPYYPERQVKKVAQKTGVKIVELVSFPGGRDDDPTYLGNLKSNINDLIKALNGEYK